MNASRLPDSFFDAMYDGVPDPWGFQTRWYEQRKLALTLAMLPRSRYSAAFEPGCSLGIVTEALAGRCDRVVATDVSDAAIDAAATRLSGYPNVSLRRWALGDPWPAETFDLIVLSEVGYYLEAAALGRAVVEAQRALEPGGTLLAVHWRHPVPEYPLTGDKTHAIIAAADGLARLARYRDEDVLLETYQKVPPEPRSVAADDGLVP
ncbi:MAG: class I SAM-dependent methyltransferase [Geodermatophilaceae bacterium]